MEGQFSLFITLFLFSVVVQFKLSKLEQSLVGFRLHLLKMRTHQQGMNQQEK